LDCELKALSEVRRPEATLAAISQTFRVNARNLFVESPVHQFSQFGPTSAHRAEENVVQIND